MWMAGAIGAPVGTNMDDGSSTYAAGEFGYAQMEALTKISVGAAVKSYMADLHTTDPQVALRLMVQEGLLAPEVLDLQPARVPDDVIAEGEELFNGVAPSTLEQLYKTKLYGSHAADMLESIQRWEGVTPEGIDSWGFMGGQSEYSVQNLSDLEGMLQLTSREIELPEIEEEGQVTGSPPPSDIVGGYSVENIMRIRQEALDAENKPQTAENIASDRLAMSKPPTPAEIQAELDRHFGGN
jgi:hypothetical protein